MTDFLEIHARHPQPRLIDKAAQVLARGVIVYPTDSYYALGCLASNVGAIERIRQIRGLQDEHLFSLCCVNLSQVGQYAIIDNAHFRLIRAHTPGPYALVLPVSKRVSRKLYDPKRRSVAFRIPSHPVAQALLEAVEEPILTTTLQLPGDEEPLSTDFFRERLRNRVDVVLDAGSCNSQPTTVLDFTASSVRLIRPGLGEVDIEDDWQE